jgi:hypothetical protein
MSIFDPSVFLEQTVDAPLETVYHVCPEGDYRAMTDDFDASAIRTVEFTYKKGEKKGEEGTMHILELPWIIDDDKVKQLLERDKVVVRQSIILDIDDAGQLAVGKNKNVGLGKVAEVLGVNGPGFQIGRLRGRGPCIVKVKHRVIENSDQKVAEVVKVSALR